MHKELSKQILSSKRPAYIEGWLSIIINTLLFGLKLWAGIVSKSVALVADAWHTLSDSISSIIVLIGVKWSEKPADEEHPFGHGRAELIAGIIIGVLLGVIAFHFLFDAIHNLIDKNKVAFGTFAIVVTVISIILKEAIAQYAFWGAKKINSVMLKADAWHHRSDAISSVVILIGIFLHSYYWWIDGVMGILVSIFIGYTAFSISKESMSSLLGKRVSPEIIRKVKELAREECKKDLRLHHFHAHQYGDHIEISFHIILPDTILLKEAHSIVERIKTRIYHDMNIQSTIQIEPEKGAHSLMHDQ